MNPNVPFCLTDASPNLKAYPTTLSPTHTPAPRPTEDRGSDASPATPNTPVLTVGKAPRRGEVNLMQSPESEVSNRSITDILRQRTEDSLAIRHGKATYEEPVTFRPYAMYKQGNKIHTDSVGYSAASDLVLEKHDVNSASESDSKMGVALHSAVSRASCLDPTATRPKSDGECDRQYRHTKKKYPGVRVVRGHRQRARMYNDHFMEGPEFSSDDEELFREPREPAFDLDKCPKFPTLQEQTQAEHLAVLERPQKQLDLDKAHDRVKRIPHRLRQELKQAVTSEHLRALMADLEVQFELLVRDAVVPPRAMERLVASGTVSTPSKGGSSFVDVGAASDVASDHSSWVKLSENTPIGTDGSFDVVMATPPGSHAGDAAEPMAGVGSGSFDHCEMPTEPQELSVTKHGICLDVLLRDGYSRLVCHAVAAYYGLVSESYDAEDGRRTRVRVPARGAPALPPTTLLSVLLTQRGNFDGARNAAAQNSKKRKGKKPTAKAP